MSRKAIAKMTRQEMIDALHAAYPNSAIYRGHHDVGEGMHHTGWWADDRGYLRYLGRNLREAVEDIGAGDRAAAAYRRAFGEWPQE